MDIAAVLYSLLVTGPGYSDDNIFGTEVMVPERLVSGQNVIAYARQATRFG